MSKDVVKLSRELKHYYRKKAALIIRNRSMLELSEDEQHEVREIYKMMGMETVMPLPKLDITKFTYTDYQKLRTSRSVKEIQEALGVGSSVWANWREENIPRSERGKSKKKVAVYHDGKILIHGPCEEIAAKLGLKSSTVYAYAGRETKDKKKRTFKYLEEEE